MFTSDSTDIRQQFWKALDHSPFLMVRLEGGRDHAVPMTAQLDKDAHHAIWFYASRENRLAMGGSAMAQFVSKGHDLFACLAGTLTEERDAAVIDRHWSNQVAAWFKGGRNDSDMMMLRFDLADAEIWTPDLGIIGTFKLMTGMTIAPGEAGAHAVVTP